MKHIVLNSNLLQESCDRFIRTPKGSGEAVQEAAKVHMFLPRAEEGPFISDHPVFSPLSKTLFHDRPWLFKKLLNYPGININDAPKVGWPPLHHAIRKGNMPAFRELMNRKAEISPHTAQLAVLYGELEMLNQVMAQLPDEALSSDAREKLQSQAYYQKMRIMVLNPERARDMLAETLQDPMQDKSDCLEGMAATLRAGADVNAQYDQGNTPLHLATGWKKAPELIQFLLNEGANPDAPNENGDTPLIAAAFHNNEAALQMLLDAKANPRLKNNSGLNALHAAAYRQNKNNVRTLLEAGVDPNEKDHIDRTPMDHARIRGQNQSILNLLREYGAHSTHDTRPSTSNRNNP